MKKAISILLLSCFICYHFGYYGFYFSMNAHIETNWSEEIYGDQLNHGSQKFLEIPLSIPYMADQDEFQVTNTSFEKDGQYFRAIKQRYAKDTLQIIYVPDTAKKSLDHTIKQWITSLIQDEIPDGTGNSLLSKLFIKDYTQPSNPYSFIGIEVEEKIYSGFNDPLFTDSIIGFNTPPPEIA